MYGDEHPEVEDGGGLEAMCPECGSLPHEEGCSVAGGKLCLRCERQEVEEGDDFCSEYCGAKWAEDNGATYIEERGEDW